ncbi:MAG: histidine phosphatase family protein [Xanthomonadaceae bacterium]|nr:histidine phosphatase family protein [Xanthomonadaceae bacterium]
MKKTIKKIYIFRHGETDWNKESRFQGHIDAPLNDEGRKQARTLALKLKDKSLEAILSSDLSRAHETAKICTVELNHIPIHIDERLREAHLGEAQGKTFDEIKSHFGEELTQRWRSAHSTDADVSYPGGESGKQIINRSLAAIEEFLQRESLSIIGVATHGGVIRRIMQSILPPGFTSVPIPNCVLYEIHYDPTDKSWKKR